MNIKRRNFLKHLSAASITAVLPISNVVKAKERANEVWVSAASMSMTSMKTAKNQHGIAWFGDTSINTQSLNNHDDFPYTKSDFRGHGVCFDPVNQHHALMMARRPGKSALIMNVKSGEKVAEFHTQAPYEFQGHACFSADGKRIFITEMIHHDSFKEENGQGRIGIWDATSYKRIGELNSYGIEPHEIGLMPDKRTLVVANGGLAPELSDQESSPVDTMQSSLVFIDSATGELIERYTLDESKASIRHISINHEGTVVAALQVQRQALPDSNVRSLAAIKRPGQPLQYLDAPDTIWLGAKDYMGSVVIFDDTTGNVSDKHKKQQLSVVGMASPRGNLAIFWDVTSGLFIGYHALHDVCGISVSHNHQSFVLSNSSGDIRFIDPVSLQEYRHLRQKSHQIRWDNHLSVSVV